jgi:hypothetical protein
MGVASAAPKLGRLEYGLGANASFSQMAPVPQLDQPPRAAALS